MGYFGAGTWAVWSIDLGGVSATDASRASVGTSRVRQIAAVPEATFLEVLAVLSVGEGGKKQLLVIGDVKTGLIYSMDADTGEYEVANNAHTAPGTACGFGAAGTGGLKVAGETLYFSDAGQGTLVKVRLNVSDGKPAGKFETMARRPMISGMTSRWTVRAMSLWPRAGETPCRESVSGERLRSWPGA